MPIFDIDDLSFLATLGLGLRHVELELGQKELLAGGHGDAVSLANYGRGQDDTETNYSIATCVNFQKKVEQFIFTSFQNFHIPNNHYHDAAFLLIQRNDDSRFPYDFNFYPLGKCGKAKFTPQQILGMITTEKYQNEDINHAVYNTILNLKEEIKKIKLQRLRQLLVDLSHINSEEISLLTTFYQQDIFLEKNFFKQIHDFCDRDELLFSLKKDLKTIEPSNKKGDTTISIIHKKVDFDQLTVEQLKAKLIFYIDNQNYQKVKECISRLPKAVFTGNERCPLQTAAQHLDTEILKCIYEYEPERYEELLNNAESSTPIFIAAHSYQLENLKFLLSVRTLQPKDVMFKQYHILANPAFKTNATSYEIIQLLIAKGVTISDEIDSMRENPLARCVILNNEYTQKTLEILLPLAGARSKILAIISATDELYYAYGRGTRKLPDTDSPFHEHIVALQKIRNLILLSLTTKECQQIQEFFLNGPLTDCEGENILMNDLLEHELKAAKNLGNFKLANIIQCIFNNKSLITPFAEVKQLGFFSEEKPRLDSKKSAEEKSSRFCNFI